jgi:hexosaminidase
MNLISTLLPLPHNYPDLIDELPKDCIPFEWEYTVDHPFAEYGEILARSGLPYYVCPGTSPSMLH